MSHLIADIVQTHRKVIVRREVLMSDLERKESERKRHAERLEAVEAVQAVLQQAAQETQEQLRYQLTDIVQSTIDTVFPGRYKFCIEFDVSRGKSSASMYLEKNGLRLDPMVSNGGGVGDLVALGLRMACWVIGRTDNVLIMDEPYKNLSANFRPIMGEILKNLSRRLGLQIILVTHDTEIISNADKVFTLGLKGDRTVVKES